MENKFYSILCFLLISLGAFAQGTPVVGHLMVQGSQCIGLDCPDTTSNSFYGYNTQVLLENNLRIHFEDNSGTTASFPGNDWTLAANETFNGGRNYFGIHDATAGKEIFSVEAGARLHSLHVGGNGYVGFGTRFPILISHLAHGDSPGIRFEQNGTGGYAPYTWDVSGNETNFFIRDVTNGSNLVFRLRPGAPENSLFITSSGNLNLGVDEMTANTHKLYVNGDAAVNGDIYVLSDQRIKKDIVPLQYGLSEILKLNPKRYIYNAKAFSSELSLPSTPQVGLLAQEVETILPEAITAQHSVVLDEADEKIELKGVNYTKIVPVLINAIQEQQSLLAEKDAALNKVETELELLRNEVAQIRLMMQAGGTLQSSSSVQTGNSLRDDPNAPVLPKPMVKESQIKLNNGRDEK